MALKADTNKLMREQRIAELLRQADADAEPDWMSPHEIEELQRRIRRAPGMPEYAKAQIGNQVYPHKFAPKLAV
jgi:hypothetical protein